MYHQFFKYIEQFVSFDTDDLTFIRENLPIKLFKKGEYLLREGQISNKFFFNIDGCVRLFYLAKGLDKTAYFYTENQFISSYESYVKQIPSKQNFQAIEDTHVVVIALEKANELLERSSKFEVLARIAMEEEMIHYQQLIASFITHNPKERYLALLSNHAELFQRIPQHYIASYLGVTPESLSRIKKKIYQEQTKS